MTANVQIKKNRPNYYVVLDYRDESGGRKKKWVSTDIPVKGNHKREAEEKRKEVLREYEEGEQQGIDLGKDFLFVDFMKEWLEMLKHSIVPRTYDGYMLILNTHIIPYFKPKCLKVKDVSPLHIQQYVNFKLETLSPNTVRKHLANISKCLDSAVRQNNIAFNPVKRIDLPRKVRYIGAKHYNERQIEQLLEYSKGDPLEIVILLKLFTWRIQRKMRAAMPRYRCRTRLNPI
jgi:integrase